jgi:hypothetical protein
MPTYLMSFMDNLLESIFSTYEFLKSSSCSPKGPLMSRTQMIIIFTFKFIFLMISLDHSLVHALNKQKKISNV